MINDCMTMFYSSNNSIRELDIGMDKTSKCCSIMNGSICSREHTKNTYTVLSDQTITQNVLLCLLVSGVSPTQIGASSSLRNHMLYLLKKLHIVIIKFNKMR